MALSYTYGAEVSNKYSGSTRKWQASLGIETGANDYTYYVNAYAGWYQPSHASGTTTGFAAGGLGCYLSLNGAQWTASWGNSSKIQSYGKTHYDVAGGSYSFDRTKSDYSIYFYGYTVCGSPAVWKGTSQTGNWWITIPARPSHAINYNSNGGTGTINAQRKYYSQSDESAYYETLSNGSGFTRTGYALKSWNTQANGSGTTYALGATYTVNTTIDVTLYAQWEQLISNVPVKVGGVWRNGDVRVKVGGVWKDSQDVYIKIGGVWKVKT